MKQLHFRNRRSHWPELTDAQRKTVGIHYVSLRSTGRSAENCGPAVKQRDYISKEMLVAYRRQESSAYRIIDEEASGSSVASISERVYATRARRTAFARLSTDESQ
jgi:hypothetical protein